MASYLERVLQPGETVRYNGTLHWVIFVPGFVLLAIAAAALVGVASRQPAHGFTFYSVVTLFALVLGIAHLVAAWIMRVTTEIAVTNRRVIYKTGLISRRTVEMNMDKVESVDVTQGIIGRILDYGTVLIRGTGAGLEPLQRIGQPLALRNAITAG
jgi:uncharacterized membrane protein YdbT with pleckstrin-like domain